MNTHVNRLVTHEITESQVFPARVSASTQEIMTQIKKVQPLSVVGFYVSEPEPDRVFSRSEIYLMSQE